MSLARKLAPHLPWLKISCTSEPTATFLLSGGNRGSPAAAMNRRLSKCCVQSAATTENTPRNVSSFLLLQSLISLYIRHFYENPPSCSDRCSSSPMSVGSCLCQPE